MTGCPTESLLLVRMSPDRCLAQLGFKGLAADFPLEFDFRTPHCEDTEESNRRHIDNLFAKGW